MTTDTALSERSKTAVPKLAAISAAFIALIGWTALAIEFDLSISLSLSKGRGWGEALFLYFRFFTILTNVGIATLMSITAIRLAVGRALPSARIFNAGLVYILVTCATYETLLRTKWHPQGVQFYTDLALHDVVPALTLVFWIAFAPRVSARWRDALWLLVYPTTYFTLSLVLGVLGQGYPYDFVDVGKLGYAVVLVIGLVFIAVFYGLGLATTAVAMARDPERRAGRSPSRRLHQASR